MRRDKQASANAGSAANPNADSIANSAADPAARTAASPAHKLRLFYALWPDDATREALIRLQTTIHGRKTAYGNLHITLAFLGAQPAAALPTLKSILDHLPEPAMPLALSIDRLGYFARNGIAWAGMHAMPPALLLLQRALVQALRDNGIGFDDHASFKAHITLARDAPPPDDIPFEPIHWQASQLALVQSDTQRSGVSYRPLALRRLDGAS